MSPAALATLRRSHHHQHNHHTTASSSSNSHSNSHRHHKPHPQHHHHHHHHQPLTGNNNNNHNNSNNHHHHHRSSRTKCVGDVSIDDKQEDDTTARKRSMADLIQGASAELERLRPTTTKPSRNNNTAVASSSSTITSTTTTFPSFPSACLHLLQHIDGNHRCMDCGDLHPEWAAVSYGALLCLQCSGHHRSLGVHVSCVRSIFMDAWSLEQVIAMLEGGNRQLAQFFARHALCVHSIQTTTTTTPTVSPAALVATTTTSSLTRSALPPSTTLTPDTVTRLRYKTKAALFYRQQLALHSQRVLAAGPYRGREQSRAKPPPQSPATPTPALPTTTMATTTTSTSLSLLEPKNDIRAAAAAAAAAATTSATEIKNE